MESILIVTESKVHNFVTYWQGNDKYSRYHRRKTKTYTLY